MPTAAEVFAQRFKEPVARTLDPATSHTAAIKYNATNRGRDRRLMLDLIRERPGHTAAEYADILRQRGVHWYRAARLPTKRISELLRDAPPAVCTGRNRKCAITNHKAQTYYPVDT